ncbi:MAG: hypothetical protein KAI39_00670, partial [Desulfobulbaceae bacterium]|nr:hypothetical protein [Desulfobulbaceae bacterium]
MKPNLFKSHLTLLTTSLFSGLLVFFLILTNYTIGKCSIEDAPYDKTIVLYKTITQEDTKHQEKWEQKIR